MYATLIIAQKYVKYIAIFIANSLLMIYFNNTKQINLNIVNKIKEDDKNHAKFTYIKHTIKRQKLID